MSIPSQFSLSLELTQLFPLGPIGSAATQAVINLARELQGSDSDIVVEEDLAGIFSRFRIQASMESSFRTVVAESGSSSTLCQNILLRFGPGPTVNRALTQKRYFPMVLQCSLLSSVHEKSSLAQAIAQVFENLAEDAPQDYKMDAIPSQDRLMGVLRACEDQTSAYDWGILLLAVATFLGIPNVRASEPLPGAVLRGATIMFPIVQSLSEDRIIHIESGSGVCVLVVWAHHVMGLTVLVKTYSQGVSKEALFGTGNEQIIIDDRSDINGKPRQPSITLLEASKKDILFSIKPESDESPIKGLFKRPAKGYGKIALDERFDESSAKEIMIDNMIRLSTAMAMKLSKHLHPTSRANLEPYDYDEGSQLFSDDDSDSMSDDADNDGARKKTRNDNHGDNDRRPPMKEHDSEFLCINSRRVIDAAKLLFDYRNLKDSQLKAYEMLYSRSPFNYAMKPQGEIQELLQILFKNREEDIPDFFESLLPTARYLAILILAFAHVSDLNSASDLPLCCYSLDVLGDHILAKELLVWDGKVGIEIPEDTWFHAIALLMVGDTRDIDLPSTNLVSDRGWSVYLSTFADSDPSFTGKGFVVIEKGVPYRNGVWKHTVVDGPKRGTESSRLLVVHNPGEEASFQCASAAFFDRPLIGEAHDSFVVNLRMVTEQQGLRHTRRTGYRELCAALWTTLPTSPCSHPSRDTYKQTLPANCVSISGENTDRSEIDARLVICLTSGNKAARWRALVTIAHRRDEKGSVGVSENVLLRGKDCCIKCAINQAYEKAGNWFVIL
jgi:hypothetical protein